VHWQYRNLFAYAAASRLADDAYRDVRRWPSFERGTIGRQLMRSVDSIGANIAEAHGRWQPRDKAHFLVIARGSLCETDHWLTRAHARGLVEEVPSEQLDEIARGLSGLIRAQRNR
jgi:four helix bundle protein